MAERQTHPLFTESRVVWFVAKPTSHPTLMEWLSGIELSERRVRVKKGRYFQTHCYRWIEGVPLRDGKDALIVNWLEIEILDKAGKTPTGIASSLRLA